MQIKAKPNKTRKQKAYLKWMGLTPPKKASRLPQLSKFHKKRRAESEFVKLARSLEPVTTSQEF